MAKKIILETGLNTTVTGALHHTGPSGVASQKGGDIEIIVHQKSSVTTKRTRKMNVKR